jgi:hypothetical protein
MQVGTFFVMPDSTSMPRRKSLSLRSDGDYSYFRFDLQSGQYYGYVREDDGVNTFTGTCITQPVKSEK